MRLFFSLLCLSLLLGGSLKNRDTICKLVSHCESLGDHDSAAEDTEHEEQSDWEEYYLPISHAVLFSFRSLRVFLEFPPLLNQYHPKILVPPER